MNIKFSEVSGTLFSIVIVCLVLLVAKTLVEFIVILLAIGLVCWILGALLDGDE